jgi:hypothetical protein
MDHAYAVEKLSAFLEQVEQRIGLVDASPDESGKWPPFPSELFVDEVRARAIENAYRLGLGDYAEHREDDWHRARGAAIEALGMARSAEELALFLRPAPSIAAEGLHPWVWEPAAPLWAADARQDAVLAAARTVNRRLQQKIGRHDVGEYDLCMQSFDFKDPVEGKARLRFPGDRTTPTWRARQDGGKYVAAGAFLAIRNVAAHEDQVTWSEQEALEHLATFSVIARWIEACDVDKAP